MYKTYSFRKLFIILLDRNMSSSQLANESGISPAAISRLKKGNLISLDSLLRICDTLECKLDDIMDVYNAEV